MRPASSTHERSHKLAENEQCRHRPLRNYVLRNYVRQILIPSPNEKAKLFDRGDEATYNAFRNHYVVSLMRLSSEIVSVVDRIISRFFFRVNFYALSPLFLNNWYFALSVDLNSSVIFKFQPKEFSVGYKRSIEQNCIFCIKKSNGKREKGMNSLYADALI